ncbi:MAG: InlB B-repeat-containing protein, partial [Candidatus Sumerlaeia bacterium]|nr:InlB B-repeat-containing protein [Candidatus Sumerlaeia bacterium]
MPSLLLAQKWLTAIILCICSTAFSQVQIFTPADLDNFRNGSSANPGTDMNVEVEVGADLSVKALFAQEITTWQQLHEMRNDLAADYILMNDLGPSDLGYETYAGPAANDNLGWEPVGTLDTPFTGTLDGGGFTISGLTIDRGSAAYVGLFGQLTGNVSNLNIFNADIIGAEHFGILCGGAASVELDNVHVEGTLTGSFGFLGGLTGSIFDGVITNSSADVRIDAGFGSRVGGLAGYASSTSATNSSSQITIENGAFQIGGLFGQALSGSIRSCFSQGTIASGGSAVGGLVGTASVGLEISDSFSTMMINSANDVGGLVGWFIGGNPTITTSYFSGTLNGSSRVGGLVGHMEGGQITDSYSTGDINAPDVAGGLVGQLIAGTIFRSYATGTVTTGGGIGGGLVGISFGTITNSFYNNDTAGDGAGSLHGVSLNTSQMTGINAADNMTSLDFTHPWKTVVNGVEVNGVTPDGDGYPVLQGLPTIPQLIAVGGLGAEYTLTYNAGAGGSITGTTIQVVETGNDGASVTAVPASGYRFVEWSDGSTDNPRQDTGVTRDVSVTASFTIKQYTLTYNTGTGGFITGASEQTVDHGSDGTPVEAVPAAGYRFFEWSDGVLTATRQDMNVTADVTVTALFSQEISTWQQLHEMRNNLAGNYILMNDLGPSDVGYETYAGPAANDDLGWEPVGTLATPFTGSLDGGGFTISGMTIDRGSASHVGFFGRITGNVSNLTISSANVHGDSFVGILCGSAEGANLDTIHVKGSLVGKGSNIGGLTGSINLGTISKSSADVHISVGTANRVGGLAGLANSTSITNSSSQGSASAGGSFGGGGSMIGGLVGVTEGGLEISDSFSKIFVNSLGSQSAGGLVGDINAHSTITRSYSSGTVHGTSFVGGLVGRMLEGDITDSYSTGNVITFSGGGGLVGNLVGGTISRSYATGRVGSGFGATGGLVGSNSGTITDSYYNNDTAGDGAGSPHGTALNTSQMTGINAATNMTGFDFTDLWNTVVNGVEVNGVTPDGDGYPVLQGLPTVPQLIAVGGLGGEYTLTYNAGAGGSITGTTIQVVETGNDGTPVEAVPAEGYRFDEWSDGSTENPRQDTSVTGNVSVTASFTIKQYTLSYTAGPSGSITGASEQTVDHGSDGTPVEAVPAAGYRFLEWSDGV